MYDKVDRIMDSAIVDIDELLNEVKERDLLLLQIKLVIMKALKEIINYTEE